MAVDHVAAVVPARKERGGNVSQGFDALFAAEVKEPPFDGEASDSPPV